MRGKVNYIGNREERRKSGKREKRPEKEIIDYEGKREKAGR